MDKKAKVQRKEANEWDLAWKTDSSSQWDIGKPAPILEYLLKLSVINSSTTESESALSPSKFTQCLPNGRALIPACGVGHDVFALASEQRSVLGIEISGHAVSQAQKKRETLVESGDKRTIAFQQGDFFAFQDSVGFDIIYDPHFLCCLLPSKRKDWVKQMKSLLKKDTGWLITLIYPVKKEKSEDPPFIMSASLMKDLLIPEGFEIIYLSAVEVSIPSRKGQEWIGIWKVTT